jgi:hypothetical protein
LLLITLLGQAAQQPAADTEAVRRAKLEHMKRVIDGVVLETRGQPPRQLQRSEHPVLRYSNPLTLEHGDGATFLWLDGKRPLAAISLSFRHTDKVYWELSSLSDQPLRLTQDGSAVWQPKSCSRASAAIPDAPPPGATPAARLTQMRALARQFQVREQRRNQWQEGRLLTQPLHRWEDASAGIVDGALFGYAETTDPELLLLIEARTSAGSGDAKWYYQLGKMTSSPMTVKLNETEVWSIGSYWRNPRGPEDPYVEAPIGTYP